MRSKNLKLSKKYGKNVASFLTQISYKNYYVLSLVSIKVDNHAPTHF